MIRVLQIPNIPKMGTIMPKAGTILDTTRQSV